jgi:hypothetical protein
MDAPHPSRRPDLPDVPIWAAATMRTAAEADSLGTAATHYAALGIPVFPCVPGAKHPLTRNGFHDATTSRPVVRDWWHRHPRANIGVPTGVASGIVVVDVDVHAGASGFQAFESARDASLVTAWSLLVRTPSGGLHAYFPATASPQPCWQSPGAHVDFRGDGGYIVAPPSVIEVSGSPTSYAVIATANHTPAPLDATRLRSHLDPSWDRHDPSPEPPRPRSFGSPSDTTARPERLAAWVAALPEGGRNGGLFWAACRMAEEGHRFEASLASVGAGARDAGLDEREIRATVASAYRTTARSTRTARAAGGSGGPFTPTHQWRGIAP